MLLVGVSQEVGGDSSSNNYCYHCCCSGDGPGATAAPAEATLLLCFNI